MSLLSQHALGFWQKWRLCVKQLLSSVSPRLPLLLTLLGLNTEYGLVLWGRQGGRQLYIVRTRSCRNLKEETSKPGKNR